MILCAFLSMFASSVSFVIFIDSSEDVFYSGTCGDFLVSYSYPHDLIFSQVYGASDFRASISGSTLIIDVRRTW